MKLLDTWVGVDQAWCERRLAEGWGGLIQGAWSGGLAAPLYPTMQAECRNSLRAMRLAGGLTAFYTNAAPWRRPRRWFDETLEAVGDELEHVSFIAVDHELVQHAKDGNPTIFTTDENLQEFIRLLRTLGKPLIGYSADWFLGFMGVSGFTTNFGLDGYWHARYDGVPDLAVRPPTWRMGNRLVGKQYKGTTLFEGKVTDLNVFDDAWIAEIAQQEQREEVVPKLHVVFVQPEGRTQVFELITRTHIADPTEFAATKKAIEDVGGTWEHKKLPIDHPYWNNGFFRMISGMPWQYLKK